MSIVKEVGVLGGVAVIGYVVYKHYSEASDKATTQSQINIITSDAKKSANGITPQINDVIKAIKKNPKLQSFSKSQYVAFANSLEGYLRKRNSADIAKVFSNMKTNEDLKLLNLYFGTRVYVIDEIGNYKVNIWNLGQWMNELTNSNLRNLIQTDLAKKGITFKLW